MVANASRRYAFGNNRSENFTRIRDVTKRNVESRDLGVENITLREGGGRGKPGCAAMDTL